MAPSSKWPSAGNLIDLTADDDDDDVVRPVQPRPRPRPRSPTVANGTANRSVDLVLPGGHPLHGSAHAHPFANTPPHSASEQASYRPQARDAPSYAPSPPAKRQKLSELPHGMVYNEQVVTKSIGVHLSSYARDAVELFKNKGLDEDKLRAEVSQPAQVCPNQRWL